MTDTLVLFVKTNKTQLSPGLGVLADVKYCREEVPSRLRTSDMEWIQLPVDCTLLRWYC